MGYDIEFVPMTLPQGAKWPIEADSAGKWRKQAEPFADASAVRDALLKVPGCRSGPDDAVDYLGTGLSYARLTVRKDAVHVENNCGARDVLKLHGALEQSVGTLAILDLQSGKLHDARSYQEWWSRPL